MKFARLRTGVCTLALLSSLGCAEGTAGGADLPRDEDSNPATPSDEAGTLDAGKSAPTRDGSSADAGAKSRDAGSSPSNDAGQSDAGTVPMPMPSCAPASGCNAARYLGEISGDEPSNANLLMTTGKRSEWLTLRLKEDSNSSVSVKATITLSSSGTANYDLFVYVPDDSSSMSCVNPTLSSNKGGAQPDVVSVNESDSFASDDSRDITVEVRHIDGDCEPYTLDIRGP